MLPTIRTITGFLSAEDLGRYPELRHVLLQARAALAAAGYAVQTLRITTDVLDRAPDSEAVASREGFLSRLDGDPDISVYHLGSLSTHPGGWADDPRWAVDLLMAHPKAFLTVDAGTEVVSGPATRAGARICRTLGEAAPFECRRFAVYAGVRSSTPFYPASRVFDNSLRFAIGCQCANLAVEEALQAGSDLERLETRVRSRLETELAAIGRCLPHLSPPAGTGAFLGFDTSLAPFPADESSIARAIELSLGRPFGSAGTLATCRALTRAMQENAVPRTGLCGLMLPVIEDNILALRGIEGRYTVRELLLYSAVCATGLDTVPISGECGEVDLANCYLDLATLAVKLGKPLSARLFMEPGLRPGDTVSYPWEFAVPSRVFSL